MGSGLVFVDKQNRILLVEPTYKKNWKVPGGMVELDESPRDAALVALAMGSVAELENGYSARPI
ncbi:MAG: NUDIX hydrolase [Actinobacteria bacterium]|nr:NUDIX hydrolase [Actinomycetota bacterium]